MKKNQLIKVIVGLVAVVVITVVFFITRSTAYTITSDDGNAQLEIPKSALPEGMSIKDISITNVSVDDTMIAYELKPDGTAFSKEVTFKTTLKNSGNIIPTPFLLSKESGLEPVSGSKISLNLTKNETVISVPLTHFSILTFPMRTDRAFFSATMDVPDQVYVGDVVTAKATLNKRTDSVVLFSELNPWAVPVYDDEKQLILGRHNLGYRIIPNSVKVTGRAEGHDAVGPGIYVYNRPAPSSFIGESMFVKSSDFSCEELGTGGISFWFNLDYDAQAVDVITTSGADSAGLYLEVGSSLGLKKYNKRGYGFIDAYEEIECVARPSVPDNTGGAVSEEESKAVGNIFDEERSQVPPTTKPTGSGIVCGLPGGPACPPKKQ